MKKNFQIALIILAVIAITAFSSDTSDELCNPIAFRLTQFVFNSAEVKLSSKNGMSLPLRVEFDLGGNINSGAFIAPRDGIYHFDARLNFNYDLVEGEYFYRDEDSNYSRIPNNPRFASWHLALHKGKTVIESDDLMNFPTTNSAQHSLTINTTLTLRKGDRISISYWTHSEEGVSVNPTLIYFSGFLVTDCLPKWKRPDIR